MFSTEIKALKLEKVLTKEQFKTYLDRGNQILAMKPTAKFISITVTCLLVGFSQLALAQKSSIKVIAELPLHFGIGYECSVSKHFSVGTSIGVLTSPNSDLIIAYLRFIGTDEALVLLVEDAFQLGVVGEVNVNYNFKRNYFGAFVQAIGVQASEPSVAVVEGYFNTNVEDYPLKPGKSTTDRDHLTFRTRLYQTGILYGHRFPLKNERLEIDIEFGLSANIGSTSSISSESRDFTELNTRCNEALDEFYQKYAFIPTFGVMLVYKFKPSAD